VIANVTVIFLVSDWSLAFGQQARKGAFYEKAGNTQSDVDPDET
jgi:hypothetical protein